METVKHEYTIEELREQKREIERQIREIKEEPTQCGNAKIAKDNFPRGMEYYLAYRMVNKNIADSGYEDSPRWRSIYRSADKQDVIDHIDTIVADLVGLKKKLEEDGNE